MVEADNVVRKTLHFSDVVVLTVVFRFVKSVVSGNLHFSFRYVAINFFPFRLLPFPRYCLAYSQICSQPKGLKMFNLRCETTRRELVKYTYKANVRYVRDRALFVRLYREIIPEL